jgi:hypothetical protein
MIISEKKIILLGAALFLLPAVGGCRVRPPLPPHPYVLAPGPPPHGRYPRAGYRYRYYPRTQVYYDTSRSIYFYSSDGVWLSAPVLPGAIRIERDNFVTMELDSPKPYVRHRETLKRYPSGPRKEKQREENVRRRDRRDAKEVRKEERFRQEKERKEGDRKGREAKEDLREERGEKRSEGEDAGDKRTLARKDQNNKKGQKNKKAQKAKKDREDLEDSQENEAEKEQDRRKALWR